MREIREYNMNGTIILGVDNGYGNVKTAHRVFPTGIIKCDSEPVLSKEYIEYDSAYYIIGEGHKGFVAENLKDFKGMNLLVDVGNGTMNVMYLNNGRPIESKSWTE